jgi:integrase
MVDLLGYSPAELKTPKSGWYIDYYVLDPVSQLPRRVRMKLNRIKEKANGKFLARQVLAEINRKLAAGWSPFVDEAIHQGNITLVQAIDRYEAAKTPQLRHSSPVTYTSMLGILSAWAQERGVLDKHAYTFNRAHAVELMNHVSEVRMVGNRTYNNYLQFYRMFFAWMKEQGMRSDEPFKDFAKRREGQKTRTYITTPEREVMAEWIEANNPRFWLPCMFIYGTLIRPGELRRLRVCDVDMENQVVMVPAEQAKNGYERMPAIPDWMVEELKRMGLHKQPGKAFLVGKGMVPGEQRIGRNTLNCNWVRMRKALGWPETKQLYSLRDTGIIQLLRDGVNILDVKQQAGHQDISTTNEYLKHAFPSGPRDVRERSTPLQATMPLIGKPLFTGELVLPNPEPRFSRMERNAR